MFFLTGDIVETTEDFVAYSTAQIIRIGDLVETINPEQYGVTYIPAGQRFTLAGPAFYPDKSECRSIHGTVMYIRTDNLRVILPCERQPGEPRSGLMLSFRTSALQGGEHVSLREHA